MFLSSQSAVLASRKVPWHRYNNIGRRQIPKGDACEKDWERKMALHPLASWKDVCQNFHGSEKAQQEWNKGVRVMQHLEQA